MHYLLFLDMSLSKPNPKLDSVGMTASILCAVHCAVVPFLITSLPLLGLGFLANSWVEWSMIIFALMIGVYAIGSSFFRHHKYLPLTLMLSGFLIIITGHLFVTGWREGIVVPIGGFLIAAAHFANIRYTTQHHSCEADHFHFGQNEHAEKTLKTDAVNDVV